MDPSSIVVSVFYFWHVLTPLNLDDRCADLFFVLSSIDSLVDCSCMKSSRVSFYELTNIKDADHCMMWLKHGLCCNEAGFWLVKEIPAILRAIHISCIWLAKHYHFSLKTKCARALWDHCPCVYPWCSVLWNIMYVYIDPKCPIPMALEDEMLV